MAYSFTIIGCAMAAVIVIVILVRRRGSPRRQERSTSRARVVVVGGGFAGVYAAQALERLQGRRRDIEVILLNKENYFVFQPMLPEVISGGIGITDVVSPLRRMLTFCEIHIRDVESIDLKNKIVYAAPGYHAQPHLVPYDHLILATGNVTDFRGLPGLPEHALPFKNLADALQLRTQVIHALEEADIEGHDPVLRRQLLTFVVAGGGFSGVEVVAELNDFVRAVAKHYRTINTAELKVVLLHSQERILPEMPERLGLFAQRLLRDRGVEIMLKTRLKAATGQEAILSDGTRIPTRTLVSTVPSSSHPLIDGLTLTKGKNGRVIVDQTLRTTDTNVWAVGDCAQVATPAGDGFSPPTAQHAIRQAQTAAFNIVAAIRGQPPRAFDFRGLGTMGSLGHRNAVAQVFGLSLSGFFAWFLWRTIYLFKLPGWGRRLKVAVAWSLDLFLPADLIQLRLSGSTGLAKEHFESGEVVFEQGDVGDRLYIVLSGRAEVVRQVGGSTEVIARIGAGEYFGEMAILSSGARNASVRCVESMDVLSIPKREFGLLSANVPDLRRTFERVMAMRASGVDEGPTNPSEKNSTASPRG